MNQSLKASTCQEISWQKEILGSGLLWQEKCQEILFGRKLTGNTMNVRIMAGNSEIPTNGALK